tara:strand:+ start:90 stop:617 length:528 start_codon:yes stop_codon:yes gene_type:complete
MNIDTRYKRGQIYKLISEYTDVIYIGSTISLLRCRKSEHKSNCKSSSYALFELGNVDIVLVENYPCNNNDELRKREQEFIDTYRAEGKVIINKRSAYVSIEENKKNKKASQIKYNQTEKRKESQQSYFKTNKCKSSQTTYQKTNKYKSSKKEYNFMNYKPRVELCYNFLKSIENY